MPKFTALPAAGAITGTEILALVQSSQSRRASASGIVSGTPITATGGSTARSLGDWMANFNDTSAVEGSGGSFFYPTYFGNAGTGTFVEFNRARIGDFDGEGFDIEAGGPTSEAWGNALWPNSSAVSNLAVMSTVGGSAISGFARSSAYRTYVGGAGATGGAQGVNGFARNDDTGAGNPIVSALFGSAVHELGCNGISEAAELVVASNNPVTTVTPFSGLPAGATVCLNLTAGYPDATTYNDNISAAIHLAETTGSVKFQKGIVVHAADLDITADVDGPIAMEMGRGAMLRWVHSDASIDTKLYSTSNGTVINTARILKRSATGISTINITNDTTGQNTTDGLYLGQIASNGNAFVINQENANLNIGTNNAAQITVSSTLITFTLPHVGPLTTPASAAAAGVAGTIVWDTGFIYVCTAVNTWKRAAIATW